MDEFISFPKDIVSNEREKMAPALLTEIRAPWLGFDPSGNLQPPFVRFHNEIIKFCEFSSPSRQELRDRRSAFEDINACILETLPSAKVEIFGSHMTGIITPSSDIDIAILEVPIKDKDELGPLYELAEVIKSKKLASYCEVISNAKVPIVKLDHERTKISIDICCNNSSGLETGRIMQRFVREYPPMRHLTMVLKVFLAQRRMNDTYSGGIGSFLLCGMIVSFLQMRTRHETHVGKKLSWNLGVLLFDFFSLYGISFNYVHVGISLQDGGKYFSKKSRGSEWFNPNRPQLLAFENPSLPDIDFGKSSYIMPKIRRSFEHAHQLLSAALCDSRIESYLSYVIRTDDPLLIDRIPPELGAGRYNQLESFDVSGKGDGDKLKKKGGGKRKLVIDLTASDDHHRVARHI